MISLRLSRARWSGFVNFALLASFLSYICVHLDVSWLLLIEFCLGVLLFSYPWGDLVIDRLDIGFIDGKRRFSYALLIGYPVSTFSFLCFSLIHLQSVYYLVPVGCLGWKMKKAWTEKGFTFRAVWSGLEQINPKALFVGISGLVMISYHLKCFVVQDGKFFFIPYIDNLYHLAILGEFFRQFPPATFQRMVGLPFPSYHVFTELFLLVVAKPWPHMDVFPAFLQLNYIYTYTLFVLASYFLAERLSGSWIWGVVVIAASLLLYLPGTSLYLYDYFFYVNTPARAGGVVFLVALLLVVEYVYTRSRGWMYLALFVALILIQYKIQHFVVLIAALVSAMVLYIVKEKEWRLIYWPGLLMLGVSFGILYYFTFIFLHRMPARDLGFSFGYYLLGIISSGWSFLAWSLFRKWQDFLNSLKPFRSRWAIFWEVLST